MPVAAIIAWAVFFIVCVAWRFWYQHRLTADFGLRSLVAGSVGSIGRVGSIQWWGAGLLVVSLSALFVIPALEVASVLDRTAAPSGQIAAGITTMAAGIAITSGAQIGMGPSWRVGVRPGERTRLVTTGIFRLVRNPIFSGLLLSAIGAALLVPRCAMVAAVLGSIVGVQVQVRFVEEPYLRRTHGADYAAYAARVGRFFPGLGKRAS